MMRCETLAVPDEAVVGAVHLVDVGLHVLSADGRVLGSVDGRRRRLVPGIAAETPSASRSRCTWIIDYLCERLADRVHAPVDVIS